MAIKTRSQIITENNTDFPDNVTQLISPADLRGQMNDTADSALFPEDIDDLDLSESDVTSTGNVTKTLAEWTEDISGIDDIESGVIAGVLAFNTSTELVAATISPTVTTVETYNYAVPGDGGGAQYVRRASEPAYPGKFQSADGAWWEILSDGGEFNVRAFGAKGDGIADDAGAIQDAIDRAIKISKTQPGDYKVLIAPGRYKISKPLEVLDWTPPVDPTLGRFEYVTVTICGQGMGYLTNRMTEIFTTYVDRPAFFIQKARSVRFSGFTISGQASTFGLPPYNEILMDEGPLPWWSTYRDAGYNLTTPSGARDNGYSPYCAIAVDAFHSAIPGSTPANCYPGYEEYYAPLSVGGASSIIMVEYMNISCFIVGVAFSLSQLQIDDSVTVQHCNFTCNKVCIVSGQSQVRGLFVHNNHIQGCQVYVDAVRYGIGGGDMGTISAGIVVYCKWLIMGNSANGTATLRDVFCESLWSIGFWNVTAGGFPITFERCHFKLIRNHSAHPITGLVTATPAIDAHFHCGGAAAFYGGYIGFYNNDVRRWTLRNTQPVVFDGNIFLDGVPQCADETLVEFKSVRIKSAGQGSTYGMSKEYASLLQTMGIYGSALAPPGCVIIDGTTDRRWRSVSGWRFIAIESGTVAFTVPSPADGSATFTTANHAMLRVGDYLTTLTSITYFGESNTGGVVGTQDYRKCLIGRVASIDSGTGLIGLDYVPKYFLSGNYSVYQYELPSIHVITIGTTTSASPTITGVTTIAGAGTSSWIVGDHIQGTGIPAGARIIAVAGSTITLSHNATATGTVELYDAKLVLEEGSLTAAPTTAVWGRGTFFKNSNPIKDSNNMVLRGWVCTASGAPGTWEPQYTPATSVVVPADTLDTLLPGAGGTVTQLTSKATSVTLNKISGQITTHNESLASNTSVSFTLTNSKIALYDVIQTSIVSGVPDGAYTVTVDAVTAGSCKISIYNRTLAARGDIILINFVVIKGSVT